MDRFVGKVAIVTGSSSGIGAAISKELVKNGVIVAGLARRTHKLQELANELKQYEGKFYPIKCDVTNENEIKSSLKWVFENLGPVTILVNNAGVLRSTFLTGQLIITVEPNLYMLYSSTKHALRAISEGLRREMTSKKINVKVTNISPGYIITEMTEQLNVPQEVSNPSLYPIDIANACISVLNTPPHVVISELTVQHLRGI